jgi:hypothetical protein
MLENLKIAKPCSADWASMSGDERKRFCQMCKLHVYNLSDMTRTEAEDLITKTEGNVCVRLYKRADGTVITRDCPVGLAALRRRMATLAASVAAFLAVGWSAFTRSPGEIDGSRLEGTANAQTSVEPIKPIKPITPVKDPHIEPTHPKDPIPLMGAPMPIKQPPKTPEKTPEPPVKTPEPEHEHLMGKPSVR